MKHLVLPAALGFLVCSAASASAAVVSIQVGDDDCFGTLTASCAAGDLIDTSAITSTAGDPANTDVFGTFGNAGLLSFTFNLSLGGQAVTGGSLTAKVVGLERFETPVFPGNGVQGAQFALNGTDIGTFLTPGFNLTTGATGPVNEVGIPVFPIASALLIDGLNTLTIDPEENLETFSIFEEFGVDFLRLSVTLEDTPPPPDPNVVPLPAASLLLLSGLAAFGVLRRRVR